MSAPAVAVPGASGAPGAPGASTAAPPEVALVVCTRDRAARLPEALAALAALRPACAWELVLVDNGSADDTPRLLAAFAAAAPVPVTLAREPRPGLARARNAGVAAARAPLVVFVDDDCYPAPDLLDRWRAAFADPALAWAAGRIVLHDPDDWPITISHHDAPQAIPAGGFVEPGMVQGANMAWRRDVVLALGGFDPALGPGTPFNCEDLEMAARAVAAGHAGAFLPGPLVRHHHRRRARADVAALERSYDRGRGAYLAALLLAGTLGRAAVRHWARALRWKSAGAVAREAAGALRYLAHRARRAPERRWPAPR